MFVPIAIGIARLALNLGPEQPRNKAVSRGHNRKRTDFMPRYYFHVREGQNFCRDEEGQELEDTETARHEAISSTREIVGEKILHGGSLDSRIIEIADETGKVVETVSTREVLLKGGGFRSYVDDVTESAPKPQP